MKLKGGSILYAVFIAFLIFATCSSFILFSHFQRSYVKDNDLELKNLSYLKSAIQVGLSNYYPFTNNEIKEFQLFDDEPSSKVYIEKKPWGLYNLVVSKKKSAHHTISKCVLAGSHSIRDNNLALYLADQNKALSLAGKTIINGTCYLPKSGLKRAFIEGKSFSGVMPEFSKKHQSDKQLPALNTKHIQYLQNLFSGPAGDSAFDISSSISSGLVNNAWHQKTAIAFQSSSLHLKSTKICGRILIYSEQEIIIEDCHIDGAIFIAPVIHVRNQQMGNMQLIASDSIVIEGNSKLKYPSALCLIDTEGRQKTKAGVRICEGSYLEGDLFMISMNHRYKDPLLLQIDAISQVTGQVYVNGSVELRGRINGSLYCRSFILKTPSSLYSNHLLDAVIDRSTLPENYISTLVMENQQARIIKWLH